MPRLFIVGHPGLQGGASTELHHQIRLWAGMGLDLHLIPTMPGSEHEPLRPEMESLGVTYHPSRNYSEVSQDDAIINFCSNEYLEDLPIIHQQTKKIIWVNCMTFIFDKERDLGVKYISHWLYQNPDVRDAHRIAMRRLGSTGEFIHFIPYFSHEGYEFHALDQEKTHIGHISRVDPAKFAKETLHIYEYITSKKTKEGHFLGYEEKLDKKLGSKPHWWIKTYRNQTVLPVKDFYKQVDFIVQPTNTIENWPRIGFEAMFSGVPLIVDNRGGWKRMIRHNETGFLCDSPQDFIYWGTRLSYEPELRIQVAENAIHSALEMSCYESSRESWQKVFDSVFNK